MKRQHEQDLRDDCDWLTQDRDDWKDKAEHMSDFYVDAQREIKELQQKLDETERALWVLASDVVWCGCGHVTAGLAEKAKKIVEAKKN